MNMRAEDARDHIEAAEEHVDSEPKRRWVAVYISVLAVLLAIGSVGGSNATKDVINANIAASNLWSFYQPEYPIWNELRAAAAL